MVVGALGILKAGGAYLLLDPAHPSERLAFKLRDAEAPVLVTSEGLAPRLPAGSMASGLREQRDAGACEPPS